MGMHGINQDSYMFWRGKLRYAVPKIEYVTTSRVGCSIAVKGPDGLFAHLFWRGQ